MAAYNYRCVECKLQFVGPWLRPVDLPLCGVCSGKAATLGLRLSESLGAPLPGFVRPLGADGAQGSAGLRLAPPVGIRAKTLSVAAAAER